MYFYLRIKGIVKIKALQSQLDAMNGILKQLKSDKEKEAEQKSIDALKLQMNGSIDKIKKQSSLTEKDVNKLYNDLLAACERDLKKLKQLLENQKNKDEQERLRKIQEEMFRVQKQKEEEERKKLDEEQQRKQYKNFFFF